MSLVPTFSSLPFIFPFFGIRTEDDLRASI